VKIPQNNPPGRHSVELQSDIGGLCPLRKQGEEWLAEPRKRFLILRHFGKNGANRFLERTIANTRFGVLPMFQAWLRNESAEK